LAVASSSLDPGISLKNLRLDTYQKLRRRIHVRTKSTLSLGSWDIIEESAAAHRFRD
jgi:hypothetical protein